MAKKQSACYCVDIWFGGDHSVCHYNIMLPSHEQPTEQSVRSQTGVLLCLCQLHKFTHAHKHDNKTTQHKYQKPHVPQKVSVLSVEHVSTSALEKVSLMDIVAKSLAGAQSLSEFSREAGLLRDFHI